MWVRGSGPACFAGNGPDCPAEPVEAGTAAAPIRTAMPTATPTVTARRRPSHLDPVLMSCSPYLASG
jgi:hypothetical protein